VLDAILPFPPAIYETDFAGDTSKAEFRALLGSARARFILPGEKSGDPAVADRAYEAAGLMTLRQCDILLAIWDGKEGVGRGGTEDIVQRAVESGRPVFRFDVQGNGPFLLSSDAPADARDLAARAGEPTDSAAIASIVEHLCAPPKDAADPTAKVARKRLARFFKERERHIHFAPPWYPLLLTLLSGKRGFWKSFRQRPYVASTEEEWSRYWSALNCLPPSVRSPIYDVIMTRFAWGDRLANRYGQIHRSSYISNYMFAVVAVLAATFSILPESQVGALLVWDLPHLCEFLAIVIIAATTAHGLIRRWHERWIDYRQLSAHLRHLRALVLTGSSTLETHSPHTGEEATSGAEWVNWYCRASAREVGVLDLHVTPDVVNAVRVAITEGEVEDQVLYHLGNARTMQTVGRCLDVLSYLAFGITFAVCSFELATTSHYGPLSTCLGILTVVLPAFGAALFGIRVHGDFEGSAERSRNMQRRLSAIVDKLRRPEEMSFAELSALTEYAVVVMASELGDWNFVYRARPLALPT
jgi:hypothetical protein